MAVVVNGLVLTVAPGLFVAMAEEVPFRWYRELMLAVVSPLPQAFGVFMVVFELTIAALILSRGTARLIGLFVGAAFLVGITPLGLYTVTNLLLAATLVYLFWIDPANPWRRLRWRPGPPGAIPDTGSSTGRAADRSGEHRRPDVPGHRARVHSDAGRRRPDA